MTSELVLLRDKVVLVSGGTDGLGAAIARSAASAGASVVVSGRRSDLGEALVVELRSMGAVGAVFVRADVADVAQAQGTVRRTMEDFGRVDCVVNVAGLTERGTLLDTTPELFDRHVAVNLRAPFFVMQAAVQSMVDAGIRGTIVNVITMSSHGGQPFLAPYVATKAGLAGLTRNAAFAHRWDRIRINGLNIGWTDTPGEDRIQRRFHAADDSWRERAAESQPMGRLAHVDEIAEFVVFLLSDRSGVVTGSIIDWDQLVVGAYE